MANQHVPNTIGCQKVFVQRDYSNGTAVHFQTKFPQELEGKISQELFMSSINEINAVFAEAETLTCSSYWEGCFACLTGFLLLLCMETTYEKNLRKLSRTIHRLNKQWYEHGLLLCNPMERGLRVIEIAILSPPQNSGG
ncbi:unnamed protein product [Darwinula stevensoni]|uniref:Ras modification protein ERF4 n=1 Tax=Darwinula stevensoni TaxID=69355 RepID=A0A7R9ADI8_9CRUS|nr:unnamed protein product [Darwinula stevensoni]CAG0901149.1 unnamed protein product [Darwinula stevensoni]